MPNYRTIEQAKPALEKIYNYLEEAGRSQANFGIEGRVLFDPVHSENWIQPILAWKEIGASHLSLNTMGLGFKSPAEHLAALENIAQELGKLG
jgi:hypothetical protein